VLLQIKREMQTGDPGTDDSDVTCHVALTWRFCEFFLSMIVLEAYG
jgi:hypothetical protein